MRILLLVPLVVLSSCAPASDNPLAGLLSPENLENAEVNGVNMTPGGDGTSIVLRFSSSEAPGTVVIPVPELARDWSQTGAVTFESTSNSTIRYNLTIRNAGGETFHYRVHPFADVPVKVSIPGRLWWPSVLVP